MLCAILYKLETLSKDILLHLLASCVSKGKQDLQFHSFFAVFFQWWEDMFISVPFLRLDCFLSFLLLLLCFAFFNKWVKQNSDALLERRTEKCSWFLFSAIASWADVLPLPCLGPKPDRGLRIWPTLCQQKSQKCITVYCLSQEQQHSQRIKTDIQDERIYTTAAVLHSTKVMTRRRN